MITDKINHPSHYTSHPSGVECIEITEGFSFNIGNAIKYLWRADEKGAPLDDLKKAGWYIEREITRRINAANTITEIEFPEPAEKPVDYSRWLNLRALLIAARNGDHLARSLADDIVENLEGGSLDGLSPKNLVTKSASSPTTGTVLAYAQAGDARRQVELGIEYYYAENGRTQNYETAVEWWKLAAAQGDAEAQWLLGNAYLFGRGVEKNKEEAERLWKLAEQNRKAKPADLVTKSVSSPNPTPTQPQ